MKNYKSHCKKLRELSEKLFDIINKEGRHKTPTNQSVKGGYWVDLWWLACRFEDEAKMFEGLEKNLKDFVKEEIAKKILLGRGIKLDEIIDKYRYED